LDRTERAEPLAIWNFIPPKAVAKDCNAARIHFKGPNPKLDWFMDVLWHSLDSWPMPTEAHDALTDLELSRALKN
jgi:hypothetical protein